MIIQRYAYCAGTSTCRFKPVCSSNHILIEIMKYTLYIIHAAPATGFLHNLTSSIRLPAVESYLSPNPPCTELQINFPSSQMYVANIEKSVLLHDKQTVVVYMFYVCLSFMKVFFTNRRFVCF